MKKVLVQIICALLFLQTAINAAGQPAPKGAAENHAAHAGVSVFLTPPPDTAAYYFTPDKYGFKADGKTDVSLALQQAINQVKKEKNFGILFIPEGKYLISKTIYVPAAVRLIGYGADRPLFKLKDHAAGFAGPVEGDKGAAAYMFWFTSGLPGNDGHVPDAGAGTFYSGMSNIDLEIGAGNNGAVALRTHFAQHCFIEHVNISIGSGKAGIFDVGNEIQDVKFYGGDYGIYTTKASPGWPYMMLDTYFQGQRKAAIKTQEAGLTILRMHVQDVPVAIDIDEGFWEKLYMEDCVLDNVYNCAIRVGWSHTPETQINLQQLRCRRVPQLIGSKDDTNRDRPIEKMAPIYLVKQYSSGLTMDSLSGKAYEKVTSLIEPQETFDAALKTDIPQLPSTKQWVNVKSLGAKGDGLQDETAVLQAAIDKYPVLYLPQGRYRVSKSLHLKSNTILIGLHPFGTQILLKDNTRAFSGFGGPVPLIASGKGNNIITGIGLGTGKRNTRAVALQWEAGAASMVNDVKFLGGHGQMRSPAYSDGDGPYGRGEEVLWDRQYWSLWVTRYGGGIFKNIWSASTYAAAGVYIGETTTPGKIYAMSIEHHSRNEVRFNGVSNWKIYAMQTEEESRESTECQPLIIESSSNLQFANLYTFRVIRVKKPYPAAILTSAVKNIRFFNLHNYAQTKYTSSHSLYDRNQRRNVNAWELAALHLENTAVVPVAYLPAPTGNTEVAQLQIGATGFEMPEGLCTDSKGNAYFCSSVKKRIYKWSASTRQVTLLGDYPWEPLSLACDKEDHLLVVFKYEPMEGYLVDGVQEAFTNPSDADGTSFSGWGNSGFATMVYSLNPEDPDHSIELLKQTAMGAISEVAQAFYPAHRWRDFHDFKKVVTARPDSCWVAPDGKTIIPVVYDLARATSLAAAVPGKEVYITDEYNECSYRLQVDSAGFVSGLSLFAPRGSFAIIKDPKDRVWIADGDLYGYGVNGHLERQLQMPDRITGLAVVGKDKDQLLISTYEGLYVYPLTETGQK